MLRLKYLVIFNFIFTLIVIFCLYCLYFNKKIEKLTNTNHSHSIDISKIQQVIQEKYEIDIEAVRNLSAISKRLQEGGLTIPGNIRVQGHANIDGNFNYLPKGSIIAFNGTTAPKGWAVCNGKNGTPDLRNRFIFGSGNKRFGTKGGEENVTLTQNQMPKHNHTMSNNGSHSHNSVSNFNFFNWGGCFGNGNGAFSGGGKAKFGAGGTCFNTSSDGNHKHTIYNTGGDTAHNNMPPYYVLTYIMKL